MIKASSLPVCSKKLEKLVFKKKLDMKTFQVFLFSETGNLLVDSKTIFRKSIKTRKKKQKEDTP